MNNFEAVTKDIDTLALLLGDMTEGFETCIRCPTYRTCDRGENITCTEMIKRWLKEETNEKILFD